ncbi:MAG: PQQ-binding-like beta-propeller repeat protein [Phycisphaerae bacterium]
MRFARIRGRGSDRLSERSFAPPRFRRWPWLALPAFAWWAATAGGFQVQIPLQVAGPSKSAAPVRAEGLVPPQDRDAESWLKRAEEAADRGDWKLAADTLARVIADHGHKTVSLDEGQHFYSAAWCAQQQIAAWPAEGLETYRVLYDGEAERLFELAKKTSELRPLREIAYGYPHTTVAPRAILLLATWLIDRGHGNEAIDVLNILSTLSDETIPRFDMLQRLAVAHALAGRRSGVDAQLAEMAQVVARAGPERVERLRVRLAATERFLESPAMAASSGPERLSSAPWTQLLGPTEQAGRGPPVNPAITPDVPWHVSLPGADRLNRARVRRLIERTGRPPVWHAVSDGRLLFVATPGGVVARDLAMFDLAWQTFPSSPPRDPAIERHRILSGLRAVPDQAESLDIHTTRVLFHEYAGAISTGFGLVFAIEQSETVGEQLPTKQGEVRPYVQGVLSNENSLRAFEAATGRAVWTKGRAGPVEDQLKEAHFFSTPVVAGRRLVAPYELRKDLYLAVLKPDGTLEKKVLLGSGQSGLIPFNGVLQPAVADGTIYVPTGGGLLIALNAADCALRWLSRYDRVDAVAGSRASGKRQAVWLRVQPGAATRAQPDEWGCSPPVVSGGLVLLAPHDAEYLYAFDRRDGKVRWRFERGPHRYLVGAARRRVVLGGRRVTAVDLETGEEAWSYHERCPSGRPAIAGDHIVVPTFEGLVTLDAETGRPIGELAASDVPLGNLLVTADALYSVSADAVYKFPDTARTRALAEERLARDPNDVDAVLRLAWLAALADDWRGALEILDRHMPEGGEAAEATADILARVSHLRVTALLEIAEVDDARRVALLRRAVAAADRPDDVVRVGLAYAETFADDGDFATAFGRAMALLAEATGGPVSPVAGLDIRADVLVAERLGRYAREMEDGTRSAARAAFVSRFEAVVQAGDLDAAEHLADAVPFKQAGARADLSLARLALAGDAYESAVFFLRRAARRAAGTDFAAEALAILAVTLAEPDEGLAASASAAGRVLQEMATEYAGRRLPANWSGRPAFEAVGDVDELIATLGPTIAADSFDPARDRLHVVHQDSDLGGINAVATFHDPLVTDALWGEALPVRFAREVRGVGVGRTNAGRTCWLSGLASAPAPAAVQPVIPVREKVDTLRPAAVAGRVAVLDLGEQLFPVGLISGRCMWSPVAVDESIGPLPTPSVLAIDGVVIQAPDARTLVGIAARDNAVPRWRRRFDRRRLGWLFKVSGHLIVVDRNATWLWVLDPSTGRDLRQFGLLVGQSPPSPEALDDETPDPDARVVVAAGVVCRNGLKRVVGRDIASGRVLWDRAFRGRITDVIRLDDRHIGICYHGDRLAVVRADSGETLKELELDDLAFPLIRARLDRVGSGGRPAQGRVLLFGRTDDVPPEYKIVSYPLDDSEPWERGPYAYARITSRMMRASSDLLPVILYDIGVRRGDGVVLFGGGPRVRLSSLIFLDRASGRRLGRLFEFDADELTEDGALFAKRQPRNVTDVLILNGRVVVVTPDGFCILAKKRQRIDVSTNRPRGMERP